jgi:hypothetical protein
MPKLAAAAAPRLRDVFRWPMIAWAWNLFLPLRVMGGSHQ